MCTPLQLLWRTTCHMCVTCHRAHDSHMLCAARLFKGLYHKNYHHQYFLSSGAVTPQTIPGAITNWSVQVSAERYSPNGPHHLVVVFIVWQWTNHRLLEPSAAEAPSAQGPNIKIFQKQHTKNCKHGEVQKAGSSEALEMILPSFGQFMLEQWLRNSDDQEAALLLSLLQGG